MKSKVVLGMLTVIGMLALSTTVAHAGGGGGVPFALTSFFVCNSINGDDAGLVVDIAIPGIGPIRKGVRIGSGALACAVAKLFPAGSPQINENEIQPNAEGVPNQQLKCYTVTVSPRNSGSPPPSYTAFDQFFPPPQGEAGVQDGGIQFICAPAGFQTETR
jgi:hypothetical protein